MSITHDFENTINDIERHRLTEMFPKCYPKKQSQRNNLLRGTTRLCKLFAWTFSLEKCYICRKFLTNITMQEKDGKYIFGVVKVGDKGQIVIPRDARKVYDIKPGDALLLLGDQRGMALVKTEIFQSAIDQVMEGLPK